MDAETGMILHQRHANKLLYPASLTKIMTLLILFEEIGRGNIRLNDRIYISEYAASMVPSKIGLEPKSSIQVYDAINAMTIKSANDVAVAIAEHIGGTEDIFARLMTRRAHEIGMSRTQFKNASGLHNKHQISTARDMAKLAKFMIKHYPKQYRYYSRSHFTYNGVTYHSHNKLMKTYPGMDGMKTGYIAASGFNLIASAVQNNRRIIGVVFGGRSSKSRNAHMKKLLDNGFKRVQRITMASYNVPKPKHKPNIFPMLEDINNALQITESQQRYNVTKWAGINQTLKNDNFSKLMGEGDFDSAMSTRIETGLLSISVHQGHKHIRSLRPSIVKNKLKTTKGATLKPKQASRQPQHKKTTNPSYTNASYSPTSIDHTTNKNWTVQLGAYKSRTKVEYMLRTQAQRLPIHLRFKKAYITPLKTKDGWLFRGRIEGYEKNAAIKVCQILPDCLIIPPQ